MQRKIICDDRELIFTVKRSRRRRTVALRVDPSGAITVYAPSFVWGPFIDRFVRKQTAWILKKRAYFKEWSGRFQERQFVSGETFPVWGEEVPLSILRTPGLDRPFCQLKDGRLQVDVSAGSVHEPSEVRAALRTWYQQQTLDRLPEPIKRNASLLGVMPRSIKVAHQKSRWGSCSSRGDLRFSSRLAALPDALLEYVAIHELAHLRVADHSRRFWAVVGRVCPDYKTHRKWLRNNSWKSNFVLFLLVAVMGLARAETPSSVPQEAVALSAAPAQTSRSAEHALWEVGLAAAGAFAPDYPAAAQRHPKWIVAPYGVYRGQVVRADRDGARARFLRTRFYEIDLGIAAALASRSRDNEARAGMPDLDYLFELGPRVSVALSRLGGRGKLQFFLPVRAVFSTDLGDLQHRGYTATPSINAGWRIKRGSGVIAIMQLTSTFGNRQLSAYFYDVHPGWVRLDRAFYDARGGYMGSDLFAGILIPVGKHLRFFTGGQLLNHSGSANENSPLFKNHVNYSAATGLVWTFLQSKNPAVTLE